MAAIVATNGSNQDGFLTNDRRGALPMCGICEQIASLLDLPNSSAGPPLPLAVAFAASSNSELQPVTRRDVPNPARWLAGRHADGRGGEGERARAMMIAMMMMMMMM